VLGVGAWCGLRQEWDLEDLDCADCGKSGCGIFTGVLKGLGVTLV
jgi:hypothetical protein